jgi:nucleotide-binding universal stress UspA family protein
MTAKPIVVGVDGSHESVRAAQLGWRLATETGAPLRLVHALTDIWAAAATAPLPVAPGLDELLVADARQAVTESLGRRLPPDALRTLEIHVGRTAAVLTRAAAGAELVIVGGKRHGALARGLGGSTAHALIRAADVPVMVAVLDQWPIRRVLAAVDFSDAAGPTLAAARRLAAQRVARLRVMHAVEPARAPKVLAAHVDDEQIHQNAVLGLERLAAELPEVVVHDRVTRRGPAADAIAAEAADWEADVVVVGSHGKGWVDRMLVGSVTERLLVLLPATLLVVPVHTHVGGSRWKTAEVGDGVPQEAL